MKGIKITQQTKDKNPEIFKNDEVGSIKILNIPKSFFSLHFNNGQRTDGYHTLPNDVHEMDGFLDFVELPYNKETHKKTGNVVEDNGKYVLEVVALTLLEIDQIEKIKAKELVKSELKGVITFVTTPNGLNEYVVKINDKGDLETVLIQ